MHRWAWWVDKQMCINLNEWVWVSEWVNVWNWKWADEWVNVWIIQVGWQVSEGVNNPVHGWTRGWVGDGILGEQNWWSMPPGGGHALNTDSGDKKIQQNLPGWSEDLHFQQSKAHTFHYSIRLLSICSKQSIPNPEQTICHNKTTNAFPMGSRICCENEAAVVKQ